MLLALTHFIHCLQLASEFSIILFLKETKPLANWWQLGLTHIRRQISETSPTASAILSGVWNNNKKYCNSRIIDIVIHKDIKVMNSNSAEYLSDFPPNERPNGKRSQTPEHVFRQRQGHNPPMPDTATGGRAEAGGVVLHLGHSGMQSSFVIFLSITVCLFVAWERRVAENMLELLCFVQLKKEALYVCVWGGGGGVGACACVCTCVCVMVCMCMRACMHACVCACVCICITSS